MATSKAIDFSGVKEQGSFRTAQVEEGDYAARITKVEDKESKDGTFMYVFTIKLDKFSQNAYPFYCKLQDNQLWKLRNLAVAAGMNIPKKRLKFDPNKIVGKQIGVTMIDDEYEGKMKSVVDAVFPLAELADQVEIDETEDDEEEDGPVVAAVDPEDDDEDEAPAVAASDDDDEDEEEEKPKKKKDKKGKKKKKDVESLDISDI